MDFIRNLSRTLSGCKHAGASTPGGAALARGYFLSAPPGQETTEIPVIKFRETAFYSIGIISGTDSSHDNPLSKHAIACKQAVRTIPDPERWYCATTRRFYIRPDDPRIRVAALRRGAAIRRLSG